MLIYARMAQWNCASLENSFPQGSSGSIPGSGVSRNLTLQLRGVESPRIAKLCGNFTSYEDEVFDSWFGRFQKSVSTPMGSGVFLKSFGKVALNENKLHTVIEP